MAWQSATLEAGRQGGLKPEGLWPPLPRLRTEPPPRAFLRTFLRTFASTNRPRCARIVSNGMPYTVGDKGPISAL